MKPRPDKKGIKTNLPCSSALASLMMKPRPDKKGIKTQFQPQCQFV